MNNGDIRSGARMDLMQHTKEILKTVLLWLVIGGLINWLVQQFYPYLKNRQLWEILIPGLINLALAPLGLGVVEQLLGMERDQTPQPKRAMEWFEQSPKRNKAWLLGLMLLVLWLALQGVSRLGYLALARLFGRGQNLVSLLAMDQAVQPKLFVLGSLVIDFAQGLVQMLAYPAVILLAAHPDQSPVQCLKSNMQMIFRQPGRCFGMAAMVSLQVLLFTLAGTLIATLFGMIFVALFSILLRGFWAALLQTGVLAAFYIVILMIAGSYQLLCLIGLTRGLEGESSR